MKLRKFRALTSEKGRDDGGVASFTFEVDELIKGKVYTQADQRYYDAHGRASDPFFVDDNGCARDIKHMLKSGKIKEVYEILYIDPPWQFKNKKTGGSLKSGAAAHYDVMDVKDIALLPIQDIAAENCVLFMWWVGSQPAEALALVEAWGFKVKTMTGLVWVKKTAKDKHAFGMGFWTRQGSENCLIAVRGKPKRVNASIRAVIEAKVEKHSKKPAIFRDTIVELMGDLPRCELFAREAAPGWAVFGNEVADSIKL